MKSDGNPNWLNVHRINLEWDKGTSISFEEFHNLYTLHDSIWIGIFHNLRHGQETILAIQIDSVWLPEKIRNNLQDNSLYLFIKLTNLENLTLSRFTKDLEKWPREIERSEFEVIEGKKILIIDDIYDGCVTFTYTGESQFLAMDKDGKIINLN